MIAVQGIFFTDDPKLIHRFEDFQFVVFQKNKLAADSPPLLTNPYPIEIIDYDFYVENSPQVLMTLKEKGYKILLIDESQVNLNLEHYKQINYPKIFLKDSFSKNDLIEKLEQQKEAFQNEELLGIANRLNADYENIKSDWIEKIKAQEAALKETRLKLYNSNKRNEIMKKILFSVSFESDYLRLESILNEYIPKAADFAWVKLTPKNLSQQLTTELNEVLKVSYAQFSIAEFDLFFIRSHLQPIKKIEFSFLEKISDGVNYAISRNEKTKSLVQQEKALSTTMKSFPEPLLITDKNYNIYDSSQHFKSGLKPGRPAKCYQTFFKRTTPCENCQLGRSFGIAGKEFEYSVASQTIRTDYDDEPLFLNIYFNQFELKKYEQKIHENREIQELGLISSSIAHELNNPIGGVHSLLQLIKMSSQMTPEQNEEIDEMLASSLRIQTIIENLKEFSRKNEAIDIKEHLISDLVSTGIKAMEAQVKEAKIQITKSQFDEAAKMNLSSPLFLKTIKAIIVFLIQEFKRDLVSKNQKIKIIEVKTSQDQMGFNLDFISNTSRPQISESLRAIEFLNIQKLLIDQGFRGELFSPYPDWFGLKIRLTGS
jgi:hypothetical protein